MRIVNKTNFTIVLLLLANLAVAVYYTAFTKEADNTEDKILKNVKTLVLLSEKNNMVKETEQVSALPEKESPEEQAANNASDQQAIAVAGEQPNTPEPEEKQQDVVAASEAEKTDQASGQDSSPPVQVAKEEAETLCYTLGPFEKTSDKEYTQKQLALLSIDSSTRVILEKEISSYFLYIPPYKTRKAAMKTIAQLKKKKVRDFYLITKGERINAIALGLFSHEKHALSRFDLLKKLRFNVKMEARYRDKEIYWLDYQGSEAQIEQIDMKKLSPLPLQLYSRQCKQQ